MVEDREQSASERIAGQMAGRAEDVRKMLAANIGQTVCKHCGQVISEELGDGYWTHVSDDPRAPIPSAQCTGDAWGQMAEPDEDYDEETLSSFGLEVQRRVVLTFLMSTGGPADWLEIVCEGVEHGDAMLTAGEVESVTYHFADWFDHAELEVDEGSPLYQLAEWVAEVQS